MLIQFSSLIIASQLVIAVAADAPKFDIAKGCKTNSVSMGSNDDLDQAIKDCIRAEQTAQTQLESQWSQFSTSGKSMCVANATSTVRDGIAASYVDLLTCLQADFLAKKLEK
jgi:hypothetical protein